MSVQQLQLREVAELRWDGAIELIRLEGPESDIKMMDIGENTYR